MKSPDPEIDRVILEFRTLFWGPMCITEGSDVESAMVKFNAGLNKDVNASALERLSLRLAHVCKNETHAFYLETKEAASRYGTNDEILSQMDDILASNWLTDMEPDTTDLLSLADSHVGTSSS